MLEHAVIVVHHPGVIAINQHLGFRRRLHDAKRAVGAPRNDPVVAIRGRRITITGISVGGIPVREGGPAEIEIQAPTGTVTVRPVPVRHHVPIDVRTKGVRPVVVRTRVVSPGLYSSLRSGCFTAGIAARTRLRTLDSGRARAAIAVAPAVALRERGNGREKSRAGNRQGDELSS
jgi:hypothetical protein